MKITLKSFTKSFGDIKVIENMDLELHEGEMIALLGPSGCGKTTTLFAICGIHKINGGEILFGDQVINDLPPQKRNVGVVFQAYALYPHLSIYENIAFPLRIQKKNKKEIDKKVKKYSSLVHIDTLLERKPGQLSGGQQQRVALARALIREPNILLMDEPLSNLDAKLRLEMRSEIRRIQKETGITSILVTHDQVEAMSMCDRIALMNNGKIQQIDIPEKIYDNPSSVFVAEFIGNPPITIYSGVIDGNRFKGDALQLELPDSVLKGCSNGKPVKLGVRPEYLQPSYGDCLTGKISFVEPQGRETLYDVLLSDGATFRSIQAGRIEYALDDKVSWGIRPENILLFDDDGNRISAR
jgi:inositol-phosphate transport system ATP-binding protein